MAINLSSEDEKEPINPNSICNCAPQCCWYETITKASSTCSNRHALVCQIRREEVFGQHHPSTTN